jgi:hypothetical protein
MNRVLPSGIFASLVFTFVQALTGQAAIVAVNNAGFEQPGNAGTLIGNFGTVIQQIGAGPWGGSSSGTIGLQGPTLTIDDGAPGGTDGDATISGLGEVSVVPLTNSGEFFQVISGVQLQPNTDYRISVDITTSSALSLAALRNSGIGIGVGTPLVPGLFKSTTAPAGSVTLTSAGLSGRLTFEFTTTGIVPGEARIRLYGGDLEGVTTIDMIPNVTFDDVVFEIVPEPATAAFLLAGGIALARRRR